ncbi:DEAD/DEAH box helicase [Catellicoccus marimammalium]|uniref:ATP-dependent RNA helicase YfmL n=1 Tax=Catellicoccus marimammalium M35/04/3 TaxID=1234409 RepID=K8Z9P0_9ENTE|nr:DEAD/DEAH box helicase [Catellicoccus marimammalium]EKU27555.1 ATP-dependent RNA helicase YfmL [Catellicoccus marimammalium M35/04/3]
MQTWQKQYEKEGFTQLSTIQERAIPVLKKQKSAIIKAPTGTGKTLAYVWPLVYQVEEGKGTQLCILLPSQELAAQVQKVVKTWAELRNLHTLLLIGNANIRRQMDQLKKHPEIIVGTPGRIYELMERKKIRPHFLNTIVLDEADELVNSRVEWNFTTKILQSVQKDTQFVFVSATATEEELGSFFRNDYEVVEVKEDKTAGKVQHTYLEVPLRKRVDTLRRLSYVPDFKALVFFNHLSDLGAAAEKLIYEGVSVSTLASDQSKFERELSLKLFNEGKTNLLFTTDIASRGLDLPELSYVVQFDVPEFLETYIHRVGRIGRMGKEGAVISLVNDRERRNLSQLCKELGQPLHEIFLYESMLWDEKPEKEEKKEKPKKEKKNKATAKKKKAKKKKSKK